MIDKVKEIYIQIMIIPFFLRFITIFFVMFGISGLISTIFPIATYSVNDIVMSYTELWKSGYAYLFLFISLFVLIIGLGFFYAKNWSRYLILLYFILFPIYALIKTEDDFHIGNIMSIYLVLLLSIWYLFKKQSVVKYFGKF